MYGGGSVDFFLAAPWWAPAAGCGVFLYELVPSDDRFMWCLYETFFFADFILFFPTDFFFFLPSNILNS
jgi:hypothetical protein